MLYIVPHVPEAMYWFFGFVLLCCVPVYLFLLFRLSNYSLSVFKFTDIFPLSSPFCCWAHALSFNFHYCIFLDLKWPLSSYLLAEALYFFAESFYFFICFKCVCHWTHWSIFMMVVSKSFSDNYSVSVILVLGSIVCLFLVKFRFFWS